MRSAKEAEKTREALRASIAALMAVRPRGTATKTPSAELRSRVEQLADEVKAARARVDTAVEQMHMRLSADPMAEALASAFRMKERDDDRKVAALEAAGWQVTYSADGWSSNCPAGQEPWAVGRRP